VVYVFVKKTLLIHWLLLKKGVDSLQTNLGGVSNLKPTVDEIERKQDF
jgi:hypothetical protein